MDRELVLAVLALALGGGAYALGELGGWSLARWRRGGGEVRGGGGGGERGGAFERGGALERARGDERGGAFERGGALERERDDERGGAFERGGALERERGDERGGAFERGGALERERLAWRRIWRPLAPGLLVLAFLIGWALQEPDAAEALPILAFAIALPFALLWVRAALRAVRSAAGAAAAGPLAATVGLLRPRTIIAPLLREQLDAAALRAVLEHEEAHARHRDPLRLWLAQLATDLQWPLPGARRRFAAWRVALELARDDEALARGVDGSDLAAGLLAVARLGARPPAAARVPGADLGAAEAALAGLGAEGATQAFRQRVTRLLTVEDGAAGAAVQGAEAPSRAGQQRAAGAYPVDGLRRPAALLVALGGGLIALGYHHGELVISNLLGLGS